jgi:hypothetical protein
MVHSHSFARCARAEAPAAKIQWSPRGRKGQATRIINTRSVLTWQNKQLLQSPFCSKRTKAKGLGLALEAAISQAQDIEFEHTCFMKA